MSQFSKVEVLCPNGHRIYINVTPNTKLLQIVEECCLKQRLGSASGFVLKKRQTQKPVDLSLSVQLAGLTNNAKLDLVESKTQQRGGGTKPKVALQLEGGGRYQKEFDPLTSLWDVIENFVQDDGRGGKLDLLSFQSDNTQPVMNYMKDEILGEYALKSTSLRSLGIVDGGHLLRLSFKIISDEKLVEIRDKIDQEKARLSRLVARASSQEDRDKSMMTPHQFESRSPSQHIGDSTVPTFDPSQQIDASKFDATADNNVRSDTEPMEVSASSSETEKNQETSMEVNSPSNKKRATDAALPPRVESGPGTERSQFSSSTPAFPASSFQQPQHHQEWNFPINSHVSRNLHPQPMFAFADFKFPEETKGKDVYHNELSDVKKEDFKPCDRNSVVFSLNNADPKSVIYEEVGDAFFEHTVSDIMVLQDSLTKEVNAEEPLMTQEMRTAKRHAQLSRYSRVIIRFLFPDRNVLQALFRPLETVNALYKFVSESLEKKGADFELYTAPPKSILKDKTQTLVDSGLAPTSLVYFSAKDTMESCLATELLQNISSQSEAKKILDEYLPSKDAPVHGEMDGLSHQHAIPPASGTAAGTSSSKPPSDKVPAWFKTGKK